jgi:hypothetical protein
MYSLRRISMRKLTPEGEKLIEDIAQRHQVSVDAVKVMLEALVRGGGTMAQFSHAELGGSGQWLRGGVTMVGDMFNNALKAKVDSLASELSGLLANEPQSGKIFAPISQSQGQSSSGGGASIFASSSSQSSGDWWPADLGSPSSVGSQNDMRYAYFPAKRRLALWRGGRVEVLDTGEHIISGFGQQQGGGDSITLSSQLGSVPLASLKRIEAAEKAAEQAEPSTFAGTGPAAAPVAEAKSATPTPSDPASILSLVEKLGELRDRGVLSEEEFAAKKADLLKRL